MKVYATLLLIIALFSFSTNASSVGFQSGDAFEARDLSGSFTLFCPGQTKVVQCRGYELAPASFDYLRFPDTVAADRVELSSVNESGEITKKKLRVNADEGRSRKRVNLWVRTLFQKPLLSLGLNKVLYQFSLRGSDSLSGSFDVTVTQGAALQCRHDTMVGSEQDCKNAFSLCSRYFASQNNCQ
jgi:hypothetical protein